MKKLVKVPFNIEMAKAGAKVVTRTGLPVRIICFDRVGSVVYPFIRRYPIIGLILSEEGNELIYTFTVDGKGDDSSFDLFLFEEVKEEECQFKPFDKVLVRDFDIDKWQPAFFSCYKDSREYHYETIGGESFEQCVPYDGNEDICMTTNKPK